MLFTMIYTFLIIVFSVVADQVTKYLTVTHLAVNESFPFIENVLHFTHVRNPGAAFGMLSEHRWVFMVISTVAIAMVMVWLFVDKKSGPWFRVAAAMIVGGGIGNMIDRVMLGNVIDFIDVRCINFYVFNVADSFVCVGCGMFFVGVLISEIKEVKAKKAATAVVEENPAEESDGEEDENE